MEDEKTLPRVTEYCLSGGLSRHLIPTGATLLGVCNRDGYLVMLAQIVPSNPEEERHFRAFSSDQPIRGTKAYVGSVQLPSRYGLLHVYEVER